MEVSVFITSYNQREVLCEAVESVLSQTYPADQIIIVDDASTDNSQDLIEGYRRQYPELFTVLLHKKNTGISQVRINALNHVKSKYVTYLDGDDWFLPDKLMYEVSAIKDSPESKIVFSNNEYMNEDGSEFIFQWVDGEDVPEGDVFFQTFTRSFPRKSLFRMELVDYSAWKSIGFHDPCLELYEDFDMRIRLTNKLHAKFVNKVLSRIRSHNVGLSSRKAEFHFYALDYIFKKNLSLLSALPAGKQKSAADLLSKWVRKHGHKAILEAMHAGKFNSVAKRVREVSYYHFPVRVK
ncbi:glycosyltransferase family 2 protein [Pseudomonadota bacterium]